MELSQINDEDEEGKKEKEKRRNFQKVCAQLCNKDCDHIAFTSTTTTPKKKSFDNKNEPNHTEHVPFNCYLLSKVSRTLEFLITNLILPLLELFFLPANFIPSINNTNKPAAACVGACVQA